jgi:hypothetical protein
MRLAIALIITVIYYHRYASTVAAADGIAYLAQPQQHNSTTLVQALSDSSVSRIILLTNYSVNEELEDFKDKPLQINR